MLYLRVKRQIVGFYKMYFLLRSIRQPLNFILFFSKEAPRLIIHTRVSEVGISYWISKEY
jgi:hypothetical protein